jgi:hypothetical protein
VKTQSWDAHDDKGWRLCTRVRLKSGYNVPLAGGVGQVRRWRMQRTEWAGGALAAIRRDAGLHCVKTREPFHVSSHVVVERLEESANPVQRIIITRAPRELELA